MKKLIAALILIVTMAGMLIGCHQKDGTQIKVGFLAGPTGIGMAKMINDYGGVDASEQYDFIKYTAPKTAMVDLKSGNIDLACVSTEVAAQFFNQGTDLKVLAINCLNSICLLSNGNQTVNNITDLEGKTIYTSIQGTPKLIFQALLDAYGINATIAHTIGEGDGAITINSPDQIAPVILQNKADIILAPVHVAFNAMAKPSCKHEIILDIDALWNEKFDTPIAMGCIVARAEFIEEHPDALKAFLKEYEKSIEFMANPDNNGTAAKYVVDSTILPDLQPAKGALYNLSSGIKYIEGEDMKLILSAIYGVYGLDTIGGKLPTDEFYYEK